MRTAALTSHRALWQEPLHDVASRNLLRMLNEPDDLLMAGILWVYCDDSIDSPESMQCLVEGLIILALLAQTDRAAWIQELKLVWTRQEDANWIGVNLSHGTEPSVVGLNFRVFDEEDLQVVDAFMSLENTETVAHSEGFQSVLRGLEPTQELSTVPVCVELDFDGGERSEQRRVLQRIVELVQRQEEYPHHHPSAELLKDAAGVRRARMAITEIRVITMLDEAGLRYLARLGERGIAIHMIPLLHAKPARMVTSAFVHSLQSLIIPSSTTARGVRFVTVSDETPGQFNAALLSALQVSKCVKTVSLSISGSQESGEDERAVKQRALMWEMIASSLWDPHATHQIEKLEIAFNSFTDADLRSFKAFYRLENLSSRSANSTSGTDSSTSSIQELTGARFSLINPTKSHRNDSDGRDDGGLWLAAEIRDYDDSEDEDENISEDEDYRNDSIQAFDAMLFESRELLQVRDIGDKGSDEDWHEVILPGAGEAWIHRDDILAVSDVEAAGSSRHFRQITVSSMSVKSMAAVAEFVRLIGSETQHLAVTFVDEATSHTSIDEWCVYVLAQCTRLEQLQVNNARFRDIRVLVDCVEREDLRLRSLLLGHVEASSLDRIHSFFKALSDSRHPLTASLQELSLVLVLDDEDKFIESLIGMLELNCTLHSVSIGLRQGYRPEEVQVRQSGAARERLVRYCAEKKVFIRAAPFDSRCKLAFISAVHGESAPPSSSWSKIDAGIMSVIFQLAAPSRIRQVEFMNE